MDKDSERTQLKLQNSHTDFDRADSYRENEKGTICWEGVQKPQKRNYTRAQRTDVRENFSANCALPELTTCHLKSLNKQNIKINHIEKLRIAAYNFWGSKPNNLGHKKTQLPHKCLF